MVSFQILSILASVVYHSSFYKSPFFSCPLVMQLLVCVRVVSLLCFARICFLFSYFICRLNKYKKWQQTRFQCSDNLWQCPATSLHSIMSSGDAITCLSAEMSCFVDLCIYSMFYSLDTVSLCVFVHCNGFILSLYPMVKFNALHAPSLYTETLIHLS